ncbi:MAG: thymidylate synthase [Clostridia bacterium]|nr:thymidylate synthase [Clostridia bacterium]
MSKFDFEYAKLCNYILNEGVYCRNRTGINTYAVTPYVMQFDLEEEFPILTIKKVAYKSAIKEMLWFYQMQSNDVRELRERGVKVWNEWEVDEDGWYRIYEKDGTTIKSQKHFGEEYAHTIGTAYGWIVNNYGLIDKLIDKLKNNPDDRRMVMSLWQDAHLDTAVLPSCVWSTTWRVLDGKLNVVVNQRSCDVFLGFPFNVTQYAVLLHMLAQVTGYKPGKMTWVISDAHIYENHIEQVKKAIGNLDKAYPAPKLCLNPEIKDFYDFDNSKELKDIWLENYQNHGSITAEVAI